MFCGKNFLIYSVINEEFQVEFFVGDSSLRSE